MKGNTNSAQTDEISSKNISNKGKTDSIKSESLSLKNYVDYETYQKEIGEAEKRFDEILNKYNEDISDKSIKILYETSTSKNKDSKENKSIDSQKKKDIEKLKNGLTNFKEKQSLNINVMDEYEKIINNNKGCLDDNIFEEKCIKMLKKKYSLTEFDEFPIFRKIMSLKNGKKCTQLAYYNIQLKIQGKDTKNYFFLSDDNDYIPINYINLYILIEKKNK